MLDVEEVVYLHLFFPVDGFICLHDNILEIKQTRRTQADEQIWWKRGGIK